jgi:cobalt-zinc-cadmium efflux system membrane fusion protein
MRTTSLLLLLHIIIRSCGNTRQESDSASAPEHSDSIVVLNAAQLKQANLTVARPEPGQLSEEIILNGMMDVPPQNLVSLSFPFGGFVRKLTLLPGMHVQKGETIAILEDAAYVTLQRDFLVARSRLEYLRLDKERQEKLHTADAVSDKTYQQIRNEFEMQQAEVAAAAEKLRLLGLDPATFDAAQVSRQVSLRSPIDGYVASVRVNTGKAVQPTDVLFELVDPKDLHLTLTVFEKDIDRIEVGQRVWAVRNDATRDTLEAEVILVSHNLDEQRKGLVHCHLTRSAGRLLPGMFMRAGIRLSGRSSLVVPEDAVVRYAEGQFVFAALNDSSFVRIPVKTGLREEHRVEITSKQVDLTGRPLVVRNAYSLLGKALNTSEE